MSATDHSNKQSSSSAYHLQKSEMINGKLQFDEPNGFEQALNDGFFLVKIPEMVELSNIDNFARNFYKPKHHDNTALDSYRGYNQYGPDKFSDPLLGFHQRKYQIEQFLLERRLWKEFYPSSLVQTGEALCKLSTEIVQNVLEKINIPKKHWDIATGGCSITDGAYHLTFNHFRPQKDTLGLMAHRDDGFITILRSINPGLEIFLNDEWVPLGAEKDYFKINFGLTMQILTENADIPVAAVLHRVIQQKQVDSQEDRWSWGHFTSCRFGENYDRGIYTYHKENGLSFYSDAREHINKNDSEIYK
jgi:hypothetical protein